MSHKNIIKDMYNVELVNQSNQDVNQDVKRQIPGLQM